jgi:hypothetical protein
VVSGRNDDPRIDSVVATGRGDDGTTGLLYGGPRIEKDDPRTEAYGTIDEAVAALGLARAELGMKAQYGVLGPGLDALADLILRSSASCRRRGELATTRRWTGSSTARRASRPDGRGKTHTPRARAPDRDAPQFVAGQRRRRGPRAAHGPAPASDEWWAERPDCCPASTCYRI